MMLDMIEKPKLNYHIFKKLVHDGKKNTIEINKT